MISRRITDSRWFYTTNRLPGSVVFLLTRSVLMISAAVSLPAKFYLVILRGGRWSSGDRRQMREAKAESKDSVRFFLALKSLRPGPGSFVPPYKTSRHR